MPSLLSSPRRRRRLGWTLAIVLPLAAIVVVSVLYGKSGSKDEPLATDAAETTATVATIRVTPAVRKQVDETVQAFVRTAVIRRNLAAAWPLASPLMRQSVTHEEWLRGSLPVQPFPAAALRSAGWRLRYRNERTVGIDVMVQPKQGSGAPVAVYSAELTAPGSGPPRRFLVDSWYAATTLGAASGPPESGGSKTETTAAPQSAYDSGKLGAAWFLLPVGIVLLLVATLVGFAVRNVVRGRRAERRYREEFGRR